ncbi:MAG: acetyl-CoA hydrolase/transferase family protein [Bacteroidales bacterium]
MKQIKYISPKEAVKIIKSGDRVHLHGVACSSKELVNALIERGRNGELKDVTIQHTHTQTSADYGSKEFTSAFNVEQLFVDSNFREHTQKGYAQYVPAFLFDTQRLIRQGYMTPDVVLCMVSPPDEHGYVSLGLSVMCTLAAIEVGKTVIAAVNPNMPRTHGDALMHIDNFDIFTVDESPIANVPNPHIADTDRKIGRYTAELVEDGATLQIGIGSIPNAVLSSLTGHKNLGVHTEMFVPGLLQLIEMGVINNSMKKIDIGKLVATFMLGDSGLYQFADNNPMLQMKDVAYTNDPRVVAQNPKATCINSAIQIDLTGQVCADSIGSIHYSGVGGQMDFMTGAAWSKGGKAVIAMRSTTKNGESKISPFITLGGGITSTRANVHWVVTEYGAVNLFGRTLQQRAKLLTSIAHPKHRESLEKAAFERFGEHYLNITV